MDERTWQVGQVLSRSSAGRLSVTALVLALVCAACFPWAYRLGSMGPLVVGAAAVLLAVGASFLGGAARSTPLIVAGALATLLLPAMLVITTVVAGP
ncbi:hypothetical protein [Kineococcus gypseus]|uniref:hypothetical protein n=1 Tax=Kineococcus gypseus TaxID=1637102 RepID=UPI003D7ECE54